jgi:hypothetical protein
MCYNFATEQIVHGIMGSTSPRSPSTVLSLNLPFSWPPSPFPLKGFARVAWIRDITPSLLPSPSPPTVLSPVFLRDVPPLPPHWLYPPHVLFSTLHTEPIALPLTPASLPLRVRPCRSEPRLDRRVQDILWLSCARPTESISVVQII